MSKDEWGFPYLVTWKVYFDGLMFPAWSFPMRRIVVPTSAKDPGRWVANQIREAQLRLKRKVAKVDILDIRKVRF